jgi:diaminopimelate epimerase
MERFAKYHGLGNDFVILDRRQSDALISAEEAIRLCDRHRGIGADGVLSVLPSRTKEASVRMHLYNADGSTAEMCGNGLRCVVRFVLGDGAKGGHLSVDTDGGLREGWIEGDRVRVTLGRPVLVAEKLEIEIGGRRFEGMAVSMGNPHFVLAPFDLDRPRLFSLAAEIGPQIERDRMFPDRTNVELFAPRGDRLDLVVFERGAGLTQACGTGAGATAFAARRWGLASDSVRVVLPGGELKVDLGGPEGLATITGDAVHVFDGTIGD